MRERESTARELRLLESANDHFGLLHYEELVAAGLKRGGISARLDTGRLTEIHHCVYSFGHSVLRDEGRWLAAHWSRGRDTALSHFTASAYFGWRTPDPEEDVHVTTTRSLQSRDGIIVHRTAAPSTSAERRCVPTVPATPTTSWGPSGARYLRLVWDDLHPDEAARTATKVRQMLAAGARLREA